MNLRLAEKNDSFQIAEIHKKEIGNGFLSSFETNFLSKIYSSLIDFKDSFCIVAEESGNIIGFIAGTSDLHKFYYHFFRTNFLATLFTAFRGKFNLLRLKKIFEVICYPYREKNIPKAELLTIAVRGEFQGQGIAPKMLKEFIPEMEKRKVVSFKAVVGKELLNAINFYEKNGFKFLKETEIHNNQKSRIYIYRL